MSESSKIEWTDATWNPVMGCTPVSEGCTNCYARTMIKRYAGRKGWPSAPSVVTLFPKRLSQPSRWKGHKRIFIPSMGDLFHEDVPDYFIWYVWWEMARAKQHIFQVLTKRPERMCNLVKHFVEKESPSLLSNIWLGVTAENQKCADERREYLRQCPAAVKFVSYEPALGPIGWAGWEFVNQIISGGESGPQARPSHPNWHRATRDFCQEHGIAYFMKQWGAWAPRYKPFTLTAGQQHTPKEGKWIQLGKSGNVYSSKVVPDEWCTDMIRVGKKAAGRLLDGKEWNEFPCLD